MPEVVVPVCAPALRDGRAEGVLPDAPLVHLDALQQSVWFDWASYLRAQRPDRELARAKGEMRFNTYSLVIEAALAGQGWRSAGAGLSTGCWSVGIWSRPGRNSQCRTVDTRLAHAARYRGRGTAAVAACRGRGLTAWLMSPAPPEWRGESQGVTADRQRPAAAARPPARRGRGAWRG